MLHATKYHAPTTPWQTTPPLAQLPVLREAEPQTTLRPMPAASSLASALCSSRELLPSLRPLALVHSLLLMYLPRPRLRLRLLMVVILFLAAVRGFIYPSTLKKKVADAFHFLAVDSHSGKAQRTGSSESSGSSATSTASGSSTTESGAASQIGIQLGVAGVLGAVMAAFFL